MLGRGHIAEGRGDRRFLLEGEILIRWGFKPKVLGYIPNVRGAVTGVP